MQREGLKRTLIVMGILFAGFIYVGSVNAQTHTSSGGTTCSSSEFFCFSQNKCVPMGTQCDATAGNTAGGTVEGGACPTATPIRCSDGTCAVAAANCPSSTGSFSTTCSGTLPIWCPVKNMCVGTAAECVSTGTDTTGTATTHTCSSSQRWCSSKSMCVDEWTPCEGSCGGGKYYCSYQDNSSSSGWCSSSPCTESQCISSGKKWCKNSANTCSAASSGWCTSSATENCPPYDRASCDAVKGEWCGSWCAQNGASCPAMTWPSDQTECEIYKGTWCPPMQSTSGSTAACMMGSCMMAGQNCSDMQKTMSCWDGSSSGSSCPAMPATKETCTAHTGKVYWCQSSWGGSGWCSMMPCDKDQCAAAGKHWCESSATASPTAATSGWCSSMKCMPFAPAGKMVCPDGASFAYRLKECPQKGMETHKTCPDGTRVPIASTCPEQKKTCPDGSTVAPSADCPASDYKECSNGKKVLKSVECPKEKEKKLCPDGKTEMGDGSECPLSETEIKNMKNRIDSYLKKLVSLETFFKGKEGIGDEYLKKIVDLRTELNDLPLTSQGMDILKRQVSVHISELEDAKGEIEGSKTEPLIEDLDEDNREEELAQVKKNLKEAERLFKGISNRIGKLEKKTTMLFGKKETFVVPAGLKEIVDSAKTSIALIKKAETYDEAEEAILDLQGHIESIGSYQNVIGVFLRTWKDTKTKKVYYHSDVVIKDIENSIKGVSARATAFQKSLKSSADKTEYASFVSAVSEKMDAVKDQFKKFWRSEIADEELEDLEMWAESAIFEKLEEVQDMIADAQGARTLTKFIKKMESSNKTYVALLKKTKKVTTKSGKKTIIKTELVIPKDSEKRQEAEQKIAELACFLTPKSSSDECVKIKEGAEVDVLYLKDLRKVKKDEYTEKVLPAVAAAFSTLEELDGILGLEKKTREENAREQRKERFKDASTPSLELKLQKTQDSLEDSDIRANFYRRNSLQEFARIINGKKVSYSQFAQNQ